VRHGVFKTIVIAACLILGLLAARNADAQDLRLADMQASWAPVGETTRVPYGWADLCGRQPQECQVDVLDPVDLRLTEKTAKILEAINAKVNAEITPVSNYAHWGTVLDHWDYPTDSKGDCKIYALWKRKLLIDIGFPRQALLMTIVRDLDGNGHTILTVKTDHGDFVLDNMVGEIRPWDATGYTYVKRQSQTDPNVWVSILPPANRAVAGLSSERGVN
jgi:predicted transglutaminase-like cysteine proteinase